MATCETDPSLDTPQLAAEGAVFGEVITGSVDKYESAVVERERDAAEVIVVVRESGAQTLRQFEVLVKSGLSQS